MGRKVGVDGLSDAVMKELEDYAKVIDTDMREAVTKAGQTVRKDISASAPKRYGTYSKSWSTKKTKQTFQEQVSAGASSGTRTRKARRRTDKSISSYRSC